MARTRQSEDKLLQAALKIFSTKGYTSASISDIIKEAGVARGTFYIYFNSKKNAFSEVLQFVIDEIEKRGPRTDSDHRFSSPSKLYESIKNSYRSFLEIFSKNRAFADIVFTEALGIDKGFSSQLEKHYESHRARIISFLEAVRESGLARDFDNHIVCEAIIGYTERCARVFTEKPKTDINALAAELADLEFSVICSVPLSNVKG